MTFLFSVPGVTNPFGMGYLFNPYAAYANGAAQLVSKYYFYTLFT